MDTNYENMVDLLNKWQQTLRLRDWDIRLQTVNRPWRKSGDIKIDREDKNAILLVNIYNPAQTNLEELIIHELLHLKLYDMDQTIERYIGAVYGEDEAEPRRAMAYEDFMRILEGTVHDLTKCFLELGGEERTLSFGRLQRAVDEELGDA